MESWGKSARLTLGNAEMEYVVFGRGERPLVILPGLGDALTSLRGKALLLALNYRIYARHFRVYLFARKAPLEENCTTETMAADQARAMEQLGLGKACVLGVSQGGMIAQHLAADYPERVEKLVLAVSAAEAAPETEEALYRWMELACRGDYKTLMTDTAERSYSAAYKKRYRWVFPLLGYVGKPRSFRRFLLQAEACRGHRSGEKLRKIQCPALVIGGGDDRIVGTAAAEHLCRCIPGSRGYVYPELGHALYDEAGDFHRRVLDFFLEK